MNMRRWQERNSWHYHNHRNKAPITTWSYTECTAHTQEYDVIEAQFIQEQIWFVSTRAVLPSPPLPFPPLSSSPPQCTSFTGLLFKYVSALTLRQVNIRADMSSGDISLLDPKGVTHCIMEWPVWHSIEPSVGLLTMDAKQEKKTRREKQMWGAEIDRDEEDGGIIDVVTCPYKDKICHSSVILSHR